MALGRRRADVVHVQWLAAPELDARYMAESLLATLAPSHHLRMRLTYSLDQLGERWAELCEAYGAETVHLETEWGEKVDRGRVDEALASAGGRAETLG